MVSLNSLSEDVGGGGLSPAVPADIYKSQGSTSADKKKKPGFMEKPGFWLQGGFRRLHPGSEDSTHPT